jgi:hypothetical protein
VTDLEDIEVLDAVLPVHVMQRSTLAQDPAQETAGIPASEDSRARLTFSWDTSGTQGNQFLLGLVGILRRPPGRRRRTGLAGRSVYTGMSKR